MCVEVVKVCVCVEGCVYMCVNCGRCVCKVVCVCGKGVCMCVSLYRCVCVCV